MKSIAMDLRALKGGAFPETFAILEQRQLEYNWYLTCQQVCGGGTLPGEVVHSGVLLSGEAFTRWFGGGELYLAWGVCSAVPKGTTREALDALPPPDWESPGYWQEQVTLQLPIAELEITVWDGSLLLFVSREDRWAEKWLKRYPQAMDLEKQNQMDNRLLQRIDRLLLRWLGERGQEITEEALQRKFRVFHRLCTACGKKSCDPITDEEIVSCFQRV